ncbi:RNA polymerase sigma factor [Halobacillus sp. BBL2006]|uniref:RNA polymerase sigma factor n=1 Tax=Halobacillus sp. BBL2006 TaxID=1543706 RepID=UPI000541E10A|nr:sigma-70 family RNA polymerase sigma factor [Halobacillus sp. BBL2006]KHE71833.1 hypothetical protein LD39_07730 [Halobacillus sp. BBL2006]
MKASKPSFQDYKLLIYSTLHKLNIPEPFDDYLQEAYLVFQKSVHNYCPSKSKFSTYFVHELIFHLRSYMRKEQRNEKIRILLPPPPHSPDETLHEHSLLYDLLHHSNLSLQERNVCLLSYQGYTVAEIARKQKVSESTIKRRRKSIRNKVGTLLFMWE